MLGTWRVGVQGISTLQGNGMELWRTDRRRSGNNGIVLSLKVPVRVRSGSTAVKSGKRAAWYTYINQHLAHNRHPKGTADAVPMCKSTFADDKSTTKTGRETTIPILPTHNSQLTSPAFTPPDSHAQSRKHISSPYHTQLPPGAFLPMSKLRPDIRVEIAYSKST